MAACCAKSGDCARYIAEALEAQSPSQFVGLSVENNGTAGSTR
jgi:hypothetical protein